MFADGSAALTLALPSRICVSIGETCPETLLRIAHTEASRGETLFEFCLEYLTDPQDGPGVVRQFARRWPNAWVIATCREGARSVHAPADQRLASLAACVDAGARLVDLEVETASHSRQWMRQMGGHCIRIVSYHNYRAAPPLAPLLKELEAVPADIIKVAVATRDAPTLCQLIEQARQYPRPVLFLAMGPFGLPTRILGACAGRSFTYGSHRSARATAAGQLDIQTLRETYRLDEVSHRTAFIAGFPGIAEETSHPVAYNKALARAGADMIYVPWPGVSTIPSLLFTPALHTSGVALHHQFASQALAFADQVERGAQGAGFIDTLWKHQERWIAGWKLGDSIVTALETESGVGAGVAVMSDNPQQRHAVEKLLGNHGHRVVASSRAEWSIDLQQMVLNDSGKIRKIDLRSEVIRRQVECWVDT
jgi:3-dehydroquinate dehydratase type I